MRLEKPNWLPRASSVHGVDDRVSNDALLGVKVLDRVGLAEVFDAKTLQTVTIDTTWPTECSGMSVQRPHDAVRTLLAKLVFPRIKPAQPFIDRAADSLGLVFLQKMDAISYECCVDVLQILDHPI